MADKILIIDDDRAFSRTLCRALQRRGFEVDTAAGAEQALQQCQASAYDKIVLDLKIGEASGLQILPELKTRQPTAAILILTGYASIPTAVEAIKRGAANYLCKPADTDMILAAFRETAEPAAGLNAERPSVKRLEWEHIQAALQENNGNISATARQLKMHRRTLQRKLQKKPISQ